MRPTQPCSWLLSVAISLEVRQGDEACNDWTRIVPESLASSAAKSYDALKGTRNRYTRHDREQTLCKLRFPPHRVLIMKKSFNRAFQYHSDLSVLEPLRVPNSCHGSTRSIHKKTRTKQALGVFSGQSDLSNRDWRSVK